MEYTVELKTWEDPFYEALAGKKIAGIKALQVNPKYFAFDPERIWVIDGGVVFSLEDGQELTFAWNKEVELMDMQFCEPTALLGGLDFYEIEEVSAKVNNLIANNTVSDIAFEWNWYQMLNDDFELEEQLHYAPLGLTLTFEDGQTLQLASIRFALQGQTLADAKYLPEGDMLVSINELVPISLEEDGDANNMIDY